MIKSGWWPDYFPKSATNIEEGHNIGTNRVWASFNYHARDIEAVEDTSLKITESPKGNKFLCPPYEKETITIILRKNGSGIFLSYANGI